MKEIIPQNCCIIGDDTLVIQCAEIILEQKIDILGIVSNNPVVLEWSYDQQITTYISIEALFIATESSRFDYLFSIVPNIILSEEVLKLPRRFPINFHDGPLPKYAGLHATTWAILNNEKIHGVTWHLMTNLIDGGDVLKQCSFNIEPQETALSLNLKCYEYAVQSFRELILDLKQDQLSRENQNLSKRTYYGLRTQLPDEGFISWDQPAEDIDRMCRALHLGHYSNPLGMAKFIVGDKAFLVKGHQILKVRAQKLPGTIVDLNDKYIQISTATEDIQLLEILQNDGQAYPKAKLQKELKIHIGYQLKPINLKLKKTIRKIRAASITHENFWVKKLSDIERNSNFAAQSLSNKEVEICSLTLSKEIFQWDIHTDHILTVILVYLYRLNNYHVFPVGLNDSALQKKLNGLDQFFSSILSFYVSFEPNFSFSQALTLVRRELNLLSEHFIFATDITARYPEINKIYALIEQLKRTNISISENGLQLNITLNKNISLKNMRNAIIDLIQETQENPEKLVSQLCIVDHQEKEQLIYGYNNTQFKYPYANTVINVFEEQVKKTPSSVVAIYNKEVITYDELNKKSNKIARFLQRQSVQPKTLIGICLEGSLDILAVILGVIKAGFAYLPLEPTYPSDRLSYMAKDSKATSLIIQKPAFRDKFIDYEGNILFISEILQKTELEDPSNLPISPSPEDLAYVIYTSGTTGNPKGIAITHRSLNNHMAWMQKQYNFNSQDIFIQKTPFSFDASVWEFFISFYSGAKLLIAPNFAYADSHQLIELIITNGVTVLQVVPTILKELLAVEKFKSCNTLKKIFCGGEALMPELIRDFFKKVPIELHNLYGPTEATIDTTTLKCTPADGEMSVCLIGKPIMNAQVYVLDQQMQLLPIGAIGELYIGGEGLAKGYLHQPELTQKKFIKNPYSKKAKNKLYKTGDLVRWRQDGGLEYLGRCDDQIKIRGCRIELTEVENYIYKFPSIEQCVVTVQVDTHGNKLLAAYLMPHKNTVIYPQDLRNFLLQFLPPYMIPSQFYTVDHFLKTVNGKIDRKNFSQLNCTLLTEHKDYTAPSNQEEETLVHIWESTLKIKPIGIHDSFFDLGGNSLDALRISFLIQAELNIKISLGKLFEFPTIHELTQFINSDQYKIHNDLIIKKEKLKTTSLIHLHKGYIKNPLFLIHPIGGSIFWYKYLAKYFDKNRSLYAIQDPGIEANKFLFSTLEEMAAFYVEIIQMTQAQGPYLLGGASFGATVAVEMAKQLKELGERVEFIGLLDGWAFYHSLENDKSNFDNLMREQNQRIFTRFIQEDSANANFLLNLQWHREKLLSHYQIPKLDAKLTLFKAIELWGIFKPDPVNGWKNYSTQAIECYLVPGNHETMFYEPHIQTLAKKLNHVLNLVKVEQRKPQQHQITL